MESGSKLFLLFSLLLLGLLIPDLSAHTDTPLEFKNGSILGLPPDFQPAKFDQNLKKLTIRDKELVFPEVLHDLFQHPGPNKIGLDPFADENHSLVWVQHDLKFLASWYHGPSFLPPYLLIKIEPKDRQFHFEILVDLIEVSILEARTQLSLPRSSLGLPIKLTKEDDPYDWKKNQKQTPILGRWENPWGILEINDTTFSLREKHQAKDASTDEEVTDTVFDGLVETLDPEHLVGKISYTNPSSLTVTQADRSKETFSYARRGDILEIYSARGMGGGFALSGTPIAKLYERLDKFQEKPHEDKGVKK